MRYIASLSLSLLYAALLMCGYMGLLSWILTGKLDAFLVDRIDYCRVFLSDEKREFLLYFFLNIKFVCIINQNRNDNSSREGTNRKHSDPFPSVNFNTSSQTVDPIRI